MLLQLEVAADRREHRLGAALNVREQVGGHRPERLALRRRDGLDHELAVPGEEEEGSRPALRDVAGERGEIAEHQAPHDLLEAKRREELRVGNAVLRTDLAPQRWGVGPDAADDRFVGLVAGEVELNRGRRSIVRHQRRGLAHRGVDRDHNREHELPLLLTKETVSDDAALAARLRRGGGAGVNRRRFVEAEPPVVLQRDRLPIRERG